MSRQVRWTLVVVSALGFAAVFSCQALRRTATKLYPQTYSPQEATDPGGALEKGGISLTRVASGFEQPTCLEFVPGAPTTALVLEKTGALEWLDVASGETGTVAVLPVNASSEQGLLGIAFHPRFTENRRFFLNYTLEHDSKEVSRVEEWLAPATFRHPGAKAARVVLEVEQPYANHNGGHLAFGPDGFLYVGFGDGGYRDDPQKAGQDLKALLGKMLRLDVDRQVQGKGYAIPADNPFVGNAAARPEIWAYGLRNPWRYAFAPDGRLVVADVGQNEWEEVGFAAKGENLGWNVREARHCFDPKEGCASTGLREPFFEYGRTEGQSVTGGVVVTGARTPALKGRYVFGDFVSGRLWALELPDLGSTELAKARVLGKFPVLPVHFTLDEKGDAYLVDFAGSVLRIDPS
jgi:glucose/arabinose dehydrogenase